MTPAVLLASVLLVSPASTMSPSPTPTPDIPLSEVAIGPGPAGSLVLVDSVSGPPLVTVVIAARTGSATDPKGKAGLAYLGTVLARRGAGDRDRSALDEAFDSLGAQMVVEVDPDSVRLRGNVLERHLDAFLDLLASIVLSPRFDPRELGRTRNELIAQMDEARNDDRTLCERFFDARLYGTHPYGTPVDGTPRSLRRIRREDLLRRHRQVFVGQNLVFAAAGPLDLAGFQTRLAARFGRLRRGPAPKNNTPAAPKPAAGWRVQLVDKPDRQQTQIMFGQPSISATDPDRYALALAMASFGGGAMTATLMDEVRTKRGLAYSAYMDLSLRRGPGALRGWLYTSTGRTVKTLKLVLRLYTELAQKGLPEERLPAWKQHLIGTYAAELDDPAHRLSARVAALLAGLPVDEVDRFAERIAAVTPAEINAAIARHIDPQRLAITLLATASVLKPMLLKSGVAEGAIDVVPWTSE